MHIELHQSIAHHPKTYALARVLNERRSTAIGMLSLLWLWAMDNSSSGQLDLDPGALADTMDWPGQPDSLVKALVACRWLDNVDGVLYIHDWDDNIGRQLKRQAQNRQRQERFRQKLYHLLGKRNA